MIRLAADGPTWDDGIEIISATPEWIRLLARCDQKTADRVVHFLAEVAELPDEERIAVGMAWREMLMNAVEHGAKMDPTKYLELAYVRAKHMVMCRVKDPGEGFTLDDSALGDRGSRRGSDTAHELSRGTGDAAGRLWSAARAKARR